MCAAPTNGEGEATAFTATTGLNCKRISFDWKIQQFDVIQHMAELINAQNITVTVPPGPNCVETKWRLVLHANVNSYGTPQNIQLNHELVVVGEKPADDAVMYSYLSARHGNLNGDFFQCNPPRPKGSLNKDAGSVPLGGGYPPTKFSLVEDGALTIHISLSVFTYKPQSQLDCVVKEEMLLEVKHQTDLYQLANGEEWADIKLISKEGVVHLANKAILSVRSPVFAKMFKAKWEEGKFGVVRLKDISNSTLIILLQYINNGKICSSDQLFATLDEFENLVYSADKYELEDLRKYCDTLLANQWTLFAAADVSELAKRFRLLNAEARIEKHVKENSAHGPN